MKVSWKKRAKRGRSIRFSLIELLLVMVILALLAALLLQGTTRVRETARRLQCRSVIGQYAQGVALYAAGNDDFFPTTSFENYSMHPGEFRLFWQLLEPYLAVSGPAYLDTYGALQSSVRGSSALPARLVCPSARISFDAHRPRLQAAGLYEGRLTRGGAYYTAMSDSVTSGGLGAGGRRLASIPQPGSYFFMEDTGFNDGTDDREFPCWKLRDFLDGKFHWGHGKFYNLGFLDGHVSGFPRKRRQSNWQVVRSRVFEP